MKDNSAEKKKDVKEMFNSLVGEKQDGSVWSIVAKMKSGSTHYFAIKKLKKDGSEKVSAVVCKTKHANGKFLYEVIEESENPEACDCSSATLAFLDETDNKNALLWRERCEQNNKNKAEIKEAPYKTVFSTEGVILVKEAPRYQFKTDWFRHIGEDYYYEKSKINYANGFKILPISEEDLLEEARGFDGTDENGYIGELLSECFKSDSVRKMIALKDAGVDVMGLFEHCITRAYKLKSKKIFTYLVHLKYETCLSYEDVKDSDEKHLISAIAQKISLVS